MKKVLLAAAVLVLGTSALSAKTNTPWFIGGEATANVAKFDKVYDRADFAIAPQVGYMFNDSWGIALDLGYSLERVDKNNYVTMGVGLSGLHVAKITDKFFYTPALRLGYGMAWTKLDQIKKKVDEASAFGGRLDFLKFEFRPSCHWGLTFGFGSLWLQSAKPKEVPLGTPDKAYITGGLNLTDTTVGFKYYF